MQGLVSTRVVVTCRQRRKFPWWLRLLVTVENLCTQHFAVHKGGDSIHCGLLGFNFPVTLVDL